MDKDILIKTVARLTNPPKGILAVDESAPTCNARFEKLGVASTEENRRAYRELLITAPHINQFISGFIFYDETIRQSTKDHTPFPSVMTSQGMDVGIKVDMGTKDFPNHEGEKVTDGLDGLSLRLKEYRSMGATFAKWRAVYTISDTLPSEDLMHTNAETLTKYALACQAENIVPIIEPEILYEGTHTIERCYEVTAKNLDILFKTLEKQNVFLEGLILKTSMVLAGKDAKEPSSPAMIAGMTVRCLKEHVPENIGAIVFLSGGQGAEESTMSLNIMHQMGPLPWNLTFSYSRAIQNKVLEHWAKNPNDAGGAQEILLEVAKANSLASIGKYEMKVVTPNK